MCAGNAHRFKWGVSGIAGGLLHPPVFAQEIK